MSNEDGGKVETPKPRTKTAIETAPPQPTDGASTAPKQRAPEITPSTEPPPQPVNERPKTPPARNEHPSEPPPATRATTGAHGDVAARSAAGQGGNASSGETGQQAATDSTGSRTSTGGNQDTPTSRTANRTGEVKDETTPPVPSRPPDTGTTQRDATGGGAGHEPLQDEKGGATDTSKDTGAPRTVGDTTGSGAAGQAGGDTPSAVKAEGRENPIERFREEVPPEYSAALENPKHVQSGQKGSWNAELNKPEPNTAYVVDGNKLFVTDDRGRTVFSGGQYERARAPSENTDKRHQYNQTTAGTRAYDTDAGKWGRSAPVERRVGDEGGHLQPAFLGGPGERINTVPQTAELNRGAGSDWARSEANMRRYLASDKSGNEIQYVCEPVYQGDAVRPSHFLTRWRPAGEQDWRDELSHKNK